MKQAKEAKMPPLGPNLSNNDPVSVEELVYQLSSKKTSARMLSKDKKIFLSSILKNKKEILLQCNAFDSTIGTSLYAGISSLIPINTRVITRDASNSDLAQLVAELLYPLKNYVSIFIRSISLSRVN